MKRTLLFILAFLPMLASADPVEIGGICYNLVEGTKEAEVTVNFNIYRGDITIPESVEYEGITYSVTSIGADAFYYCTGLKSVTIPNSVKTIGESAFNGCKNLSSVTIANGVTSIGVAAFQLCTSLTSLTIPNSVTAIAEGAFQGCSGLQSIVVDKGNTVYDSREDCNALIKTSDNKLITGCMNTTIPNSITAIGSWAFFLCDGLTSINIPNSVTGIEQSAFWGCKNLVSINIPNSVTEIEEQTFALCEALTSVTIPNSVTTIGDQAFSGCIGLTSVTIGSKVKTIGSLAFTDCLNLLDVYCYAEKVPETQNEVFRNSNIENVTLHVPAASISAYQAVEPWKNFKEIVALKDQENMAYRPMIEDGKMWKVGSKKIKDNLVKLVGYYYFDGDTIIGGKTCKKMMFQQYVTPDYPEYDAVIRFPLLQYVGAWYEEDKKVYFCNEGSKQMDIKYDFSIEANDTLWYDTYYPCVIGPRQTGGIKGFKGVYRIVLTPQEEGPGSYNTTWLEGVGSNESPTENVYYGYEYHLYFLMSCTVGDEVIYLNDEYEDGATPVDAEAKKHRFDFTHTIKTKPKARTREDNAETLYGEYNNQLLDIRLNPLDDTYLVRITNESDQVVYEKTINAGSIVGLNIDISAFAKGRYTVTIENSGESFTGEFETITTGIQELINEEETKNFNSSTLQFFNSIYNLQGQRLNRLQKGLNIVGGRKVFVK